MSANDHLSSTQFMRVRDLPQPNVLQSDPKQVAKIRRSLGTKGYVPNHEQPITIVEHAGKRHLVDGNHRTEALKTSKHIDPDTEVPVMVSDDIDRLHPYLRGKQ